MVMFALLHSGMHFQTIFSAGDSTHLVKSDELLLLGYCASRQRTVSGFGSFSCLMGSICCQIPALSSQLLSLIPHCPAPLLSDPVVFIINCFLLHSVYDTLFSIRIAWSWGSHIIFCCLILMLPNTAAAP